VKFRFIFIIRKRRQNMAKIPYKSLGGILNRSIMLMAIVTLVVGGQYGYTITAYAQASAATDPAPLAATSTMTLSVVSAADGITPITNFKYIINIDNTGTTTQRSPADGCSPASPGYPGSCQWVSIASTASFSPIYTQGNQDDFNGVLNNGLTLPDGRYLISILADGYKIDGEHFTVPFTGSGLVTVKMQPYDLPDGTIQAAVFEDTAPTNSAPDVPAERGLSGFVGHIHDYIDEVTTNVYGDPLCGDSHCVSQCYVVNGGVDLGTVPPIDSYGRCPFTVDGAGFGLPGQTLTVEGKLEIPNLGPNRYALSITPPDGSGWIQTTTLEGNHDWDSWVMEGSTGLDTEFVVSGEPFPATFFGYVLPSNTMGAGSNTINGQALAVSAYIPPVGGIVGETGLLGAKPKDKNPIKRLFVSLSDINNGDQTVYVEEFDCNAACDPINFSIPGVPDGDYVLGLWDEPQDYIFGEQNVSVHNGEVADLGSISMLGWWTTIEGHVFNDTNANGKMDPGEPGIPNFPIVMRTRENSIMDRGTTAINTDASGYYWMESAYPITQWLVEEAYVDGFYTTGVTYQADNQPTETTVLGAGVDVNLHPVIGLGGRLDWGVKAYDPGTNGGIVGTVSYDTTRNELNPQYSAIENWQPSIAGLPVDLYAPLDCPYDPFGVPTAPCDPTGSYQLNPDGSYARGALLNQYISETWERPSGCIARNVDDNPLVHGVDENVLPLDPNAPCIEAPMMGVQFGPMATDVGTPNENFGATVDGNFGFGDGCFGPGGFDTSTGACADGSDPTPLPSNMDFLVKVEIPNDALGRPMYQVTKEEDINIANGDSFVPQVPPPECAGPLHTVDLADSGTDNYGPVTLPDPSGLGPGTIDVPASTPIDNPNFVGMGGTIYEGEQKPLCDMKLVHLSDRKSIAPGFTLFTDVPLPGRFWGLMVDDLNFSSNPQSTAYGEKLPLSFAPVGIYDYTNRLITTVETDYNGFWDVLLPSTNRISCPTPSGVCANLYRFVGDDPGTPGHWNPNYNAQYRTIAAEFEAFPGLTLPADLAPTPVSVAVQIPGIQTMTSVACMLDAATPQLFSVSKPYIYTNASIANRNITIQGLGFGATQGTGRVTFDNATLLPVSAWGNNSITFSVPGSVPPGPHQLKITAANGRSTVNGLTFHVVVPGGGGGGSTYNPTVFEVGPGRTYATIQSALDAAAGLSKALVVVYPGQVDITNPRYNGRGAYYENIIISSPVKLQGVGPGGVYADGTPVQGTIIDGIAFGGDTTVATNWLTKIGTLTWDGNQNVYDGEVIYIVAHDGQFTSGFNAAIDGLDIRGGDQMGLPGNLNAIFGGFPGPLEAPNIETQGGAIFANAYARYLQVTNNVVESNGGSYGAIRFGTPNIDSQHNENVRIANNRIIANGGTNLAGAIGLFNGSNNYEIANNDLCGNFSAEYGGAISHFGLSPTGRIHDNRIYFNSSYDEGAGITIAGELPLDPTANYGDPNGAQGSGPVNIYNNLIQANLSDDDGGGLRFLMAGDFPMNIYNNMIVNNISTHEGGGVAIDDASNVRFFNNTVMKNITTATAVTSNGQPAPAGLSTGMNSTQLQGSGVAAFTPPLLFNNIFSDNRAGTRGTNMVTGIGAAGDLTPINLWDMGAFDAAGLLTPTNSLLDVNTGVNPSPTNLVGANPTIASPYDVGVTFTSWRTNINFIGAIMVTADLPPNLLGNYHLLDNTSPAYNFGAANKSGVAAPTFDIDNDGRPAFGAFDSGADEIKGTTADLAITKTDGKTQAIRGLPSTYTIVVSNLGPDASNGTVTDNLPTILTNATWTCAATAGSNCGAASGSGNINTSVSLLFGGSATFTLNATVSNSAVGGNTLSNTATVAVAAGSIDPISANNSATDSDTISLPLPTLGLLDNFNRANAINLNTGAPAGVNWSQTTGASTVIRVNNNQANCASLGNCTAGMAIWNGSTNIFGATQGAAFTYNSSPLASRLILKAGGGTLSAPLRFIRVRATGTQVIVESTTNSGGSFTTRGTFTVSLVSTDTLTAVANADGSVDVWRTTSGNVTTYLGHSTAVATFNGTGRIGMQLMVSAFVDNFSGGTLP
jgi:uncharacterized repeat protein (TIGR01451 family)